MLTLFQPRGADYAHHITASTPGFENLKTSLKDISKKQVDLKCKQNVKTISDVLAKSQSQGTPFQQIQIGKYNLGLEKQDLWDLGAES